MSQVAASPPSVPRGARKRSTLSLTHTTRHILGTLFLVANYPHVQSSIMTMLSAEALPATRNSSSPLFNNKDKAPPSRHQWSRMQTMPRPRRGSVRAEPNFQEGEWEVPNGYDYTKPTHVNYAAAAERAGEVHGDYKEVRATRDFDYHGNYSRERQLFQGMPSPARRPVLATGVASYCFSSPALVRCSR